MDKMPKNHPGNIHISLVSAYLLSLHLRTSKHLCEFTVSLTTSLINKIKILMSKVTANKKKTA